MSPVTRTSASIPAQRSFNAVTGGRVKISKLVGDDCMPSISRLGVAMLRPVSADGSGVFGGL